MRRGVLVLLLVSCASSPPPVQATEARALVICRPADTWEDCITSVRHDDGEDASGERGPAQKTLELAVAFCTEREPWRQCLAKIRSISAADAERDACVKSTPRDKLHRCR